MLTTTSRNAALRSRAAGSLVALSAAFALALGGVACGFPKTAPPPAAITSADVTAAQASFPDAPPASLEAGRTAFLAKCNGCHDYPSMTSVSTEQWPATMKKMAEKAKLSADEERDTLRFVVVRSRSAPRP